jgi:hypothetical protein
MMTFINIALLGGLLAVFIPLVIHLFSREKYEEVDWAAMQFLQVCPRTHRMIVLEQVLLLMLRMGIVALVALAFAAPIINSQFIEQYYNICSQRDVIVLIDGSASMAFRHNERTAADVAKEWATTLIDKLQPGDRVAIFQARHQLIPLFGTLTHDHEQAKNALGLATTPRGGVDWPTCVQSAFSLLRDSPAQRDVVILTDGQRYGWADENTQTKWELIRRREPQPSDASIWVVNVDPNRPIDPQNLSLDPIVTSRAVASEGREVTFRSAVRFHGRGEWPKIGKVRLEIDGRSAGEVPIPSVPTEGNSIPLTFTRSFPSGSHLITLQLDTDALPSDNRQDFALEVLPTIPVLIVDGSERRKEIPDLPHFLADALAPARDPQPSFLVRVVSIADFSSSLLNTDLKNPGTSPRVIAFTNVERFTREQSKIVEKFLNDGGSILITLGERCDAGAYNRTVFRGGQGWLPARLIDIVGSTEQINDAPRPQPESFNHPVFTIFRDKLPGGLHTAYFPKRWAVESNGHHYSGSVIAVLTNSEPFLVECGYGRGRVVQCVVPLDNSWRTNFHTLPDFVRFTHEIMYYLAGARSAERNLEPGQPLLFTPLPDENPKPVSLHSPDRLEKLIPVKQWPLIYNNTYDPGAYRIVTAAGRTFYFAVQPDPQESVLTSITNDDKARVAAAVGKLEYVTQPEDITARRNPSRQSQEIWWLLLLQALGLLVCEIYYTRRLLRRGLPTDGD